MISQNLKSETRNQKHGLVFLIVSLFLVSYFNFSHAQTYRVAFYNVENLFDTLDDITKNDNEFLPQSEKKWDAYKYNKKLQNLSKVVIAMGEWESVSILGLAEVENNTVVEDLLNKTPLEKLPYEYVHYESQDQRGIDVALIYRSDHFKLLSSKTFPVENSRDILLVSGILGDKDTVSIWVNHWPSRRGGSFETEPKRINAAQILRNEIIKQVNNNSKTKFVIMGDFNDDPDNKSIEEVLGAGIDGEAITFNPYLGLHKRGLGTLTYKGQWNLFDQIIICSNLLKTNKGVLHLKQEEGQIFKKDWLVNYNPNTMKETICRTYRGPMYLSGFSDHLPVYIDLTFD